MKKTILILAAVAVVISAFTIPSMNEGKELAKVKQVDGYFIFMNSVPVAEYEILGTVKKTGIVMSGSPKEMFNTLLKRAKKDFPKCDGIIFDDVEIEHASCIKFK